MLLVPRGSPRRRQLSKSIRTRVVPSWSTDVGRRNIIVDDAEGVEVLDGPQELVDGGLEPGGAVHVRAVVLAGEEHGLVEAPRVDSLEQRLLVLREAQAGHAAPELDTAPVRADVGVRMALEQLAGLDLAGDLAPEVGDFVEGGEAGRLNVVGAVVALLLELWYCDDDPVLLDRWPAVLGVELFDDAELACVSGEGAAVVPLSEVEDLVDPYDALDAFERRLVVDVFEGLVVLDNIHHDECYLDLWQFFEDEAIRAELHFLQRQSGALYRASSAKVRHVIPALEQSGWLGRRSTSWVTQTHAQGRC